MPRREFKGIVVNDKADKTVTVKVVRVVKHPVYKKFISKSTKFAAHDEKNAHKIGDEVVIQESKPISKRKHWRVLASGGKDS